MLWHSLQDVLIWYRQLHKIIFFHHPEKIFTYVPNHGLKYFNQLEHNRFKVFSNHICFGSSYSVQ